MLGVERQHADCIALADRRGWPVVEVYIDDDVSAYKNRPRPAYERMIRDMSTGQVDAVVVYHLDRLHRRPRELEAFIDLANVRGIALATVTGDIDLSTGDGRMMARIMGAVAANESDAKSRRIRRQRDQLAATGQPVVAGRRPFGYERDMVTVRADEAVVVKELVERYLAGASTAALARWLNDEEIPTVSGKVGAWRSSTVRGLIGGARIAGLRVHRGEVVGPGVWPAIIDAETHQRVLSRMGDPRRPRHDAKRSRLLSGLLVCGQCGERMSAKRERVLTTGPRAGRVVTAGYYCSTTSSRAGCGRRAIRAAGLEAYVTELVLAAIATPATAAAVGPRRSATDQRSAAALTGSLQADQHRLDDLAEAFADGAIDRSQLLTGTEKIRARMDATRRQIRRIDRASVLTELPADGDAVIALWDARDMPWRRQVITALIDHIEIGPGTKQPGFQPERVDVRWRI